MKIGKTLCELGRLAILPAVLAFSASGCGDGGTPAGDDPVVRAQTEADAKKIMQEQSKTKSDSKSPMQSTREAMQSGGRRPPRKAP